MFYILELFTFLKCKIGYFVRNSWVQNQILQPFVLICLPHCLYGVAFSQQITWSETQISVFRDKSCQKCFVYCLHKCQKIYFFTLFENKNFFKGNVALKCKRIKFIMKRLNRENKIIAACCIVRSISMWSMARGKHSKKEETSSISL